MVLDIYGCMMTLFVHAWVITILCMGSYIYFGYMHVLSWVYFDICVYNDYFCARVTGAYLDICVYYDYLGHFFWT
jgi:hypothetical protein